jgi:hypothetical protein
MNRWKVAFFSLLLLSSCAIAFLAYGFIDMAYTTTYMRDSFDRTEKNLERLSLLFPKQTYRKKDILHLLRSHNKYELIAETSCSIQVDGLRFEFDEKDHLLSINTRADSESEAPCNPR